MFFNPLNVILYVFFPIRFSSGMVLLWIHSLFVSLTFCIFVIHPAMVKNTFVFKNTRTKIDKIMQFLLPPSSFSQVLCLAVIASWRFKKSRDFCCYFSKMNYHLEALKHQDADQLQSSEFTFTRVSNVEKVIIKFCSIRSIFFLMIPHLLIRRSLKLVSELGTCVMFALRLEQS